ncbi:hypothetical protein HAX54_024859 [Datura stramonium]|uniref:Uncharacterized protein n=1 Tax=Datura stramonium TaxID=4076 RepID=A0ABS8V061_DATST|nr:hypothetical protein [Datura stramonium]
MHENQLVRLDKAIPSMIQSAFKKALQPAKDKLTHLCSKVDILESEMTILQQEVATLTAPTNQPTPCVPEAVPPQVKAPRVPQMIGGWDTTVMRILCLMKRTTTANLLRLKYVVYEVNPSWALRGVATTSYMIFEPFWIDGLHHALVYLSHSHQIPCNL